MLYLRHKLPTETQQRNLRNILCKINFIHLSIQAVIQTNTNKQ